MITFSSSDVLHGIGFHRFVTVSTLRVCVLCLQKEVNDYIYSLIKLKWGRIQLSPPFYSIFTPASLCVQPPSFSSKARKTNRTICTVPNRYPSKTPESIRMLNLEHIWILEPAAHSGFDGRGLVGSIGGSAAARTSRSRMVSATKVTQRLLIRPNVYQAAQFPMWGTNQLCEGPCLSGVSIRFPRGLIHR